MNVMTAVIPHGRPFTVADLEGIVGDESYTAERPFPVTITPARLLDGTRP
jgi:hypothetical protein